MFLAVCHAPDLVGVRDCANGADFVLSFWVGWLHARCAADARFVLVSEDSSLQQTLSDLLTGPGGRAVVANPPFLTPGGTEQ